MMMVVMMKRGSKMREKRLVDLIIIEIYSVMKTRTHDQKRSVNKREGRRETRRDQVQAKKYPSYTLIYPF